MKFGLHFQLPCAEWQSPLQRYQDTLEQIQLGDELGYDNAWLAEMHFSPRQCITPSPLLIAAAAQRTKRIRLGVAINLLPLHNPVRMAEDIATLDLLSNGRVEFGVGRGSRPDNYQGYNIPMQESRERLVEALDFIITAWTHEEFSFEGKYYSAKDLNLVPKPLQKPYPPVRIASNSDDTFELVGKLGYPMFATPMVVPMPKLREGVQRYRQKPLEGGHPINGEELSLQMSVYVAKSAEDVRAATKDSVEYSIKYRREIYENPSMQRAAATNPRLAELIARNQRMTYDTWYNDEAICGDPKRCIEKLQALHRELQLGECSCIFDLGGLVAHSDVMKSIRLFAKEVMPHFR